MKTLLLATTLLISNLIFSQNVTNVEDKQPEEKYDNVLVKKLYSDTKASYFIIWIKKDVSSHKHATHTESIIVIEGTGLMTVGDKTFDIKKGDYFVIPENTFHALKVTSKEPIKVISTQTPEFLGKDRVFEHPKK